MKQDQNINNPAQFAPAIALDKDSMESHQKALAAKLGCNVEKKISGVDYLMIFVGVLQNAGIVDASHVPFCYQAARGMKANNSALRQHLYDNPEKAAAKPSAGMNEKYKNLGL